MDDKGLGTGVALRTERERRGISLGSIAKLTGLTKGYLSTAERTTGLAPASVVAAYTQAFRAIDDPHGNGNGLHTGSLITQFLNSDTAPDPDSRLPNEDRALVTRDASTPIVGTRAVLVTAIDLIAEAAAAPVASGEIVLTFQNERNEFDLEPDLRPYWRKALKDVLGGGMDVTWLWRINGTPEQRVRMVSQTFVLLGRRGRYTPYCFLPGFDAPAAPMDLLLVPGQGAMLMFGATGTNVDTALFFPPDSAHVQRLRQYADTLITETTRQLFTVFPPRSMGFDFATLHATKAEGDHYLCKDGLGTVLIRPDIYRERVRRVREHDPPLSRDEQNERHLWYTTFLNNHAERVREFYARVKTNHIRHIATKATLSRMYKTGRFSRDDNLRDRPGSELSRDEVTACLHHVADLLEKHDNFELALVDDPAPESLTFDWYVGGRQVVLFESWPEHTLDRESHDIEIVEPAVADAFREYFLQQWKRLKASEKDKDAVVAWLKELIQQNTDK